MKHTLPTQQELLFPLLEVIEARGGEATPKQAAQDLAAKFSLEPEAREAKVRIASGREFNEWERTVRWTRQKAVLQGLIGVGERNVWALTEKGKSGLDTCMPGVVVTVYETDLGVALWAEAESAAQFIDRGSVDLIMTSPPYPLKTKKQYGNLDAKAHVEWLMSCASGWRDLLADTGSLVLNVGDAWNAGSPTMSLYQERLILRLCDELNFNLAERLYWHSSTKIPSPAEWVTVRRIRVTPSVEQCYWLSKSEHPKANNRGVLRPYSADMQKMLARGGMAAQKRPSGYAMRDGAFSKNNGGAIPSNLLSFPNTSSTDSYQKACKAAGLPSHPARFPAALPEFFIKLLTEKGDVVYDPFGGSAQTARVCEELERRWITTEKSLTYLRGSATRFEDTPSFRSHFSQIPDSALCA